MNDKEKAEKEVKELLIKLFGEEHAEQYFKHVKQASEAPLFDTTKHFCANCKEETEHRVQESDIKSMPDYKLVICQECGNKELVPESALGETSQELEVDNVSVDEQRQIDDGCESGACPSR